MGSVHYPIGSALVGLPSSEETRCTPLYLGPGPVLVQTVHLGTNIDTFISLVLFCQLLFGPSRHAIEGPPVVKKLIPTSNGDSHKLPNPILDQVTTLLDCPDGHALEGPAVSGHQSHVLSSFKKGSLTNFQFKSCTQ